MNASNDWQVPGRGAEIYENVFVPSMIGAGSPTGPKKDRTLWLD
jgi:hypothetical protein